MQDRIEGHLPFCASILSAGMPAAPRGAAKPATLGSRCRAALKHEVCLAFVECFLDELLDTFLVENSGAVVLRNPVGALVHDDLLVLVESVLLK